MAEAYECDRCGGLRAGQPHQHLAWGPTEESAQERHRAGDAKVWEFCERCWTELEQWLGGAELEDG